MLPNERQGNDPTGVLLKRGLCRVGVFALLWWVLTDGDHGSWLIGVPTVIAAAVASLWLMPARLWRWRLAGVIRFFPFFFWHSVRGSIDVAVRALHPHLPLAPAVLQYRLRLPDDLARVFLVNTVSLLPGSLSAELQSDYLTIHVLDGSLPMRATLQSLEVRVAEIFGVELIEHVDAAETSHA